MLELNGLQACIHLPTPPRIWVAYSGGLDSTVLLHAMVALTLEHTELRAVHVNHGLQKNSEHWQRHCEQLCSQWQLPLLSQRIDLSATRSNVEAMARQARYQVFERILGADEWLLTGHHQDDQAETVLLQLMRGTGPLGLAAMPYERPLGTGVLLRPLLNTSREDLVAYAKKHELNWIDDPSNQNSQIRRNFVRHQVMPMLQSKWPQVTKSLVQTALNCADYHYALVDWAWQDYHRIHDDVKQAICIEKLLALSSAKRNHILRLYFQQCQTMLPSRKLLQQISQQIFQAPRDKQPAIMWGDRILRRFQGCLYLTKYHLVKVKTSPQIYSLQEQEIILEGIGTLQVRQSKSGVLLTEPGFQVCFRQGGERLRPTAAGRNRTLKNLMQEWGVPPWQRPHIPLIYSNDNLVSVVNYCNNADTMAAPSEQAWQFKLIKPKGFDL